MKTTLLAALLLITTPAWAVPTVQLTSGFIKAPADPDRLTIINLPDLNVSTVFPNNAHIGAYLTSAPWTSFGINYVIGSPLDLNTSGIFLFPQVDFDAQPLGGNFYLTAHIDALQVGWNTVPFMLTGEIGLGPHPDIPNPDLLFSGQGLVSHHFAEGFPHYSESDYNLLLAGVTYTITSTPEPATWLLLASGVVGLWGWRKLVCESH